MNLLLRPLDNVTDPVWSVIICVLLALGLALVCVIKILQIAFAEMDEELSHDDLTKQDRWSTIDLSFILCKEDASKSRNGAVHPMLEFLFYSTLTCAQADAIMLRMRANENISDAFKLELVETVKESVPDCEFYWDAHD